MLNSDFFNQDAVMLAKALLGKVIQAKHDDIWLSAMIIETEAYYRHEKGSHASLGFTKKRRALFMSPGTIYMYYARGRDSFNVSARGEGNAVLIKSGIPYCSDGEDEVNSHQMISLMQQLNPNKNLDQPRPFEKLCAGQTLLCQSLDLRVKDWDQQSFDLERFYIEDVRYQPKQIIQTTRLGIPTGRDEHLPYRFIDYDYAYACTSNPLRQRKSPHHTILMDA